MGNDFESLSQNTPLPQSGNIYIHESGPLSRAIPGMETRGKGGLARLVLDVISGALPGWRFRPVRTRGDPAVTQRVDGNFSPQQVGGGRDEPRTETATGAYKGETVKVKDAQSLLQDSLEEVTFAASETVEKKLSERRVGKKEGRPPVSDLQKAEYFIQKMPDLGGPEKLLKFVETLRRENRPTPQGLQEKAREFFQDVSHRFAALAFAREALSEEGGRPDLVEALSRAMAEMEAQSGPEIRAGVNVSLDARDFAQGGFSETGALRQFYRDTILPYEGLSPAFSSIMETWGEEDFPRAVAFLLKAAGTDIASQGPSVEPARLKRAMDDLYHLEVLGNLMGQCGDILSKMNREFGVGNSVSPRDLLAALLAMKDRTVADPDLVEKLADRVGAREPEARIYFLREFKELARQVPIKVFDGLESRERMLDALQEALDAAIEAEEEGL